MESRFAHVEIDKLTNSIENRISGDSFDTEVLTIENEDLSKLEKGWNFDWLSEFNGDASVYKLVIEKNSKVIQGLISLSFNDGFVFLNLIESSDFNIGRNKVYYGIAGNMFAFACKISFDLGNYGYVAFNSKTNLISHYSETIGAKRIGSSNQMVIEPKEAIELINKYYNK